MELNEGPIMEKTINLMHKKLNLIKFDMKLRDFIPFSIWSAL